MHKFEDFGLIPPEGLEGSTFWTVCPQCGESHGTEHPALSVSVYVNLETWLCHHCGWRGKLGVGSNIEKSWLFKDPVLPVYSPMPMTKATESWYVKRGVPVATLAAYNVGVVHSWCPAAHRIMEAIAIPYVRDQVLVNLKYRFGNKGGFFFEAGAEVIPFGLDDMDPEMTIVCATETEKLIWHGVGESRAIALPQPIPALPTSKKKDAQNLSAIHEALSFLETHEERFSTVKKFVLCLGGGPAARVLEEELGRRLGRERCWTVQWPKDALTLEELFASGGKDRLDQLIGESKPYPVKGIFEISDVKSKFDELYEKGLPPGPRTGWASMDDFYRPALGQWTLVTGIPSHGKSNWLDALMCQLADLHDWKFCLFSPENQPIARHFANLSEKYIGTAFNPKDKSAERMTVAQKEESEKWLADHFSVVLPDDDDGNWTIDGILQLARSVILRKGVQGMVIDPWNEIDHSRTNGLSETEHVSRVISKVRQFARAHSVHVWLVAHPTKMYRNDDGIYPVPTPYDVAGSAHFLNKADFCISIYRFVGQVDQTITDVYIQKVRFKENGGVGRVSLRYLPSVGRFVDDIDQAKRAVALNTKQIKPTDEFIAKGKQPIPEF